MQINLTEQANQLVFEIINLSNEYLGKDFQLQVYYGSKNDYANLNEDVFIRRFEELRVILFDLKIQAWQGERIAFKIAKAEFRYPKYFGRKLELNYFLDLILPKQLPVTLEALNVPGIKVANVKALPAKNIDKLVESNEVIERANFKSMPSEVIFWTIFTLVILLIGLVGVFIFYQPGMIGLVLILALIGSGFAISSKGNYVKFSKKEQAKIVNGVLHLKDLIELKPVKNLQKVKVLCSLELEELYGAYDKTGTYGNGFLRQFYRDVTNIIALEEKSVNLSARKNVFDYVNDQIDLNLAFKNFPKPFLVEQKNIKYGLKFKIVLHLFVPGLEPVNFSWTDLKIDPNNFKG